MKTELFFQLATFPPNLSTVTVSKNVDSEFTLLQKEKSVHIIAIDKGVLGGGQTDQHE